jgi:hypothetical protein
MYHERRRARSIGLTELKQQLVDHFVGELTVVQAGGYTKASKIIANSLPSSKRTKSGDLGELLGTEYVNSETRYSVPIKKLRWKSDRQMAMHGNDVVGVDTTENPVRVLKGECKSGAVVGKSVVENAASALDLNDGRPNPSTLAFIAKRLYEEGRDQEANVFRDLQCNGSIPARNITHLIFVLSGNDPSGYLENCPKPKHRGVNRDSVAILITDHSAFVTAVYKANGA